MSQRAQLTGEFNHSRTATATIKFVLFYWSVGTFNIQQCPQKKKLHPCILLHCFSSTLFFCFFSSASPSIFFPKNALGVKKKKKNPRSHLQLFATSMRLWCRNWTILKQQDSIWVLSGWCFFSFFPFSIFCFRSFCCCQVHGAHSQNPDEVPRWRREV